MRNKKWLPALLGFGLLCAGPLYAQNKLQNLLSYSRESTAQGKEVLDTIQKLLDATLPYQFTPTLPGSPKGYYVIKDSKFFLKSVVGFDNSTGSLRILVIGSSDGYNDVKKILNFIVTYLATFDDYWRSTYNVVIPPDKVWITYRLIGSNQPLVEYQNGSWYPSSP